MEDLLAWHYKSPSDAELAKRNLAMFEAATSAFRPKPKHGATTADSDQVTALKAQMAELQAKIDKLA